MSYPKDTSLTNGLVTDSSEKITDDEARKVVDLGKDFTKFAASAGAEGPWMLISGSSKLTGMGFLPDHRVRSPGGCAA